MTATKRVRDLTAALAESCFVKQDCKMRELVRVFEKVNSDPMESLVLVTDEQGRTVGMVTLLDMLRAVEPEFLKADYNCEVYWSGLFAQRCRNIADKPVGDFTKSLVTVDAGDTLMQAAHLMRRHQVNTLLVLDGERVMGTLGVGALFSVMADAVVKAKKEAVA